MGTDKALLDVGGKPMIERIIQAASPAATELLIIAPSPDPLAYLDLPIHPDIEPGLGPLAGLHTALTRACCDNLVLLACDLPFITSDYIRFVAKRLGPHQVCLPRDRCGRLQPLCGAYARSCLPAVAQALPSRRQSMTDFHDKVDVFVLEPRQWLPYDVTGQLFTNVNTQTDYERACAAIRRADGE